MESMFTDEQLERAGFSRWDTAEFLTTAERAKYYLDSILEDGDEKEFIDALSDIARSEAMDEIAESMGVSKESLSRSLASGDTLAFQTVAGVLRALGFAISIKLVGESAEAGKGAARVSA